MKILIIKAHPKTESFCNALTDQYIEGAKKAKHEIKELSLNNLGLEKYIKYEYKEKPELPNDLIEAQKLIAWADNLFFSYPTWWSVAPALLKVFIEITFQPGFAYKYTKPLFSIPRWNKLLLGKSARIIVTMDAPIWYYKCLLGDPGFKMMRNDLKFCGVKPVCKDYFGSVKMSSEKKKKKWVERRAFSEEPWSFPLGPHARTGCPRLQRRSRAAGLC